MLTIRFLDEALKKVNHHIQNRGDEIKQAKKKEYGRLYEQSIEVILAKKLGERGGKFLKKSHDDKDFCIEVVDDDGVNRLTQSIEVLTLEDIPTNETPSDAAPKKKLPIPPKKSTQPKENEEETESKEDGEVVESIASEKKPDIEEKRRQILGTINLDDFLFSLAKKSVAKKINRHQGEFSDEFIERRKLILNFARQKFSEIQESCEEHINSELLDNLAFKPLSNVNFTPLKKQAFSKLGLKSLEWKSFFHAPTPIFISAYKKCVIISQKNELLSLEELKILLILRLRETLKSLRNEGLLNLFDRQFDKMRAKGASNVSEAEEEQEDSMHQNEEYSRTDYSCFIRRKGLMQMDLILVGALIQEINAIKELEEVTRKSILNNFLGVSFTSGSGKSGILLNQLLESALAYQSQLLKLSNKFTDKKVYNENTKIMDILPTDWVNYKNLLIMANRLFGNIFINKVLSDGFSFDPDTMDPIMEDLLRIRLSVGNTPPKNASQFYAIRSATVINIYEARAAKQATKGFMMTWSDDLLESPRAKASLWLLQLFRDREKKQLGKISNKVSTTFDEPLEKIKLNF